MPQCSATSKRSGVRCKNQAVTGYTVCRMHGAGSPKKGRPGGRPPKSGRYSKRLPVRAAERYQEAKEDQALLELRDEVALLDVRLGDLLEELEAGSTKEIWEALLKTWGSFEEALRRKDQAKQGLLLGEIGDLIKRGSCAFGIWNEVYSVIEQRRKTVESERKRLVEMQQMVSSEQLMILMGAIFSVIRECVSDTQTQQAIGYKLNQLVEAGE